MGNQYQLSRKGRAGWLIALATTPIVAAGTIFGLTEDPPFKWEDSDYAKIYKTSARGLSAIAPNESAVLPSQFGKPGGAKTLVAYDGNGEDREISELYGIAAGNLGTHFGEVRVMEIDDYATGTMKDFDGVIYLGTDPKTTVPEAFLGDVQEGTTPVLWAGLDIDDLANKTPGGEAGFAAQYGWNAVKPRPLASDQVKTVVYDDHHLQRYTDNPKPIQTPRIVDPSAVQVLATALCGEPSTPVSCDAADPAHPGELPWAVRSANLTYLAEVPLNDIDRNDLYLAFADLYYDLLAPGTAPIRQAAVRLEDVGPESNPADLRAAADYLHGAGIPFQVAVMPIHIARTPDEDGWYGLSLLDTPDVVEALKYMQERGGTLIQHGTTHQYGALNNPYSGRTGEDFEFYRYGCTDTETPPFAFEECRNDSFITKIGTVAEDTVEQHRQRMDQGRQIMIDAGLGKPTIFETPHYGASVNAYVAMTQLYDARYEQADYYAGLISGRQIDPKFAYGQRFPYTVHDIYGSTVYPETLGNITETEQNNNEIRDPQYIIDRARSHLVVRESTASFFFHPYLELELLQETVQGIQNLGYTFVPVEELR